MTPLYAAIPPYRIEELRTFAERIVRRGERVTPLYFNGHVFGMSGEDWGLIGTYTWTGWAEDIEALLGQLKEDFAEWVACNPPISSNKRRYNRSN